MAKGKNYSMYISDPYMIDYIDDLKESGVVLGTFVTDAILFAEDELIRKRIEAAHADVEFWEGIQKNRNAMPNQDKRERLLKEFIKKRGPDQTDARIRGTVSGPGWKKDVYRAGFKDADDFIDAYKEYTKKKKEEKNV